MTVRWTDEQYAAYTRVRQGHPSGITEGVWQAAMLELLKGTGHTLVYHTHDSRRSPAWISRYCGGTASISSTTKRATSLR